MNLHLELLKLSFGHAQLGFGELRLQARNLQLLFLMTAIVVYRVADQKDRSVAHEPGRKIEQDVRRIELGDRSEVSISRDVQQPAEHQIDGSMGDRQGY